MIPKEIEIQTPQGLPPRKQRIQDFVSSLDFFTVQELRDFYICFTGQKPPVKVKADLIIKCAEALAFPSREVFREWFERLPAPGRRILWKVVQDEYVSVAFIEKELDQPILTVDESYPWRKTYSVKPELQLPFLNLHHVDEYFVINMASVIRKSLLPWLIPPSTPDDWALKESPAEVWSNSLGIIDSLPLLCDALQELLPQRFREGTSQEKLVRGGFKKKEINSLRSSSGFPSFNCDAAPDSVDMAARFILCMTDFKPLRPPDGQEALRDLIRDFFNNKPRFNDFMIPPDRNYLEFNILMDHLSRTPGYYLEGKNRELPPSRIALRDLLLTAAKDGRWFDADIMGEQIRLSGKAFSFCASSLENSLKMKADALEIGGITYKQRYYDDFNPTGIFRYEMLVKPVFKAYCLLFAALGLLDISFKSPPLRRHYHEKALPLSPYDCLKAVRITELGRWCLGLTDRQPPRPERNYQAIADRELYLVTVQGNSLERQVYLDRIGVKLGENRWRISAASFIAGCENKRQIEDRISRFKLLIDPQPAPTGRPSLTRR
jgi:hypothetical protein